MMLFGPLGINNDIEAVDVEKESTEREREVRSERDK